MPLPPFSRCSEPCKPPTNILYSILSCRSAGFWGFGDTLDSAKLKDLSDVGRALPEERTDREYDEYGDPIVASNGEYATLHDLYPIPEGHGEEVESECDEASDDD